MKSKFIMNYNDCKNLFICPITRQFFHDSVLVADGHCYERTAIIEWFSNNSKSPITGQQISQEINESYMLKDLLEKYYKNNPTDYEKRYIPRLRYDSYANIIDQLILDKKFNDLMKYTDFKWKYLDWKTLFESTNLSVLSKYIQMHTFAYILVVRS